jgi:hypothetical protein
MKLKATLTFHNSLGFPIIAHGYIIGVKRNTYNGHHTDYVGFKRKGNRVGHWVTIDPSLTAYEGWQGEHMPHHPEVYALGELPRYDAPVIDLMKLIEES